MARIPRANHSTSPTYIFQRKAFTCNSMSGRWQEPYQISLGDLNDTEWYTLREQIRGTEAFIVYSYSTPIAWWTEANGWHVVKQRFSLTTRKHQSRLYLIK